jgi:hypothetical protein
MKLDRNGQVAEERLGVNQRFFVTYDGREGCDPEFDFFRYGNQALNEAHRRNLRDGHDQWYAWDQARGCKVRSSGVLR